MDKYAADPDAEELQLLRQLKIHGGIMTNHSATMAVADRLERKGVARCKKMRERSNGVKRLWVSIVR